MKNIKFTKIIAFFMAVLMILPMIPAVDLTVFAEGETLTTEMLKEMVVDKIAKVNSNNGIFTYYGAPSHTGEAYTALRGTDYQLDVEVLITDAVISDENEPAIFVKVKIVAGEHNLIYIDQYPWIHIMYLWEYKQTPDLNAGPFIFPKYEPQDSESITKVVFKADQTTINLYADPATDTTAMVQVEAAAFDGIYKVMGTYKDETTQVLYYCLAPCEYFAWPSGYSDYCYVTSDVVEATDEGIAYPIVDFTNPAPIVGYVSPIQPRSAIFGARSGATSAVTRASAGDTNALKMDKVVKDNGNGTYTITLEAYTTGTVKVTQVSMPMDIVLVLDQSWSMQQCIYCGQQISNSSSNCPGNITGYKEVDVNTKPSSSSSTAYFIKQGDTYKRVYYCSGSSSSGGGWFPGGNSGSSHAAGWYDEAHSSGGWNSSASHGGNIVTFAELYEGVSGGPHVRRDDALMEAAQAFVNSVYAKATGPDGVAHRIAVVGFAKKTDGASETEIMTYSGGTSQFVNYNSCTDDVCANALQPANTAEGQAIINNAINNVSATAQSTNSDLGMELATRIYENTPAEGRNRVTIMFTDGAPSENQNYFMESVANGAIAEAKKQKENGVTVYTIGVFGGADASNPASLPVNSGSPARENRYMHLVSSNYPEAKDMDAPGEIIDDADVKNGTKSYYLSASSTEALNAIFVAMGENIQGSAAIELDSKTVVKDIVTPQFTLPDNTTDVSVKQVDCLTYDGSSATWDDENAVTLPSSMVEINTKEHAVDVTGFDFAHNFVAEEARIEEGGSGERNFRGRKLVIVFTIAPDPDFLGGDGVATNGAKSGIYSNGECIAHFASGSVNVALKDIKTELTPKHIYYGNTVDLTGILDLWIDLAGEDHDVRINVDGVMNAYVDLLYTIKLNNNTIATYYVPAGEVWGSVNCIWTDTTSTSATALLRNYQALEDTSFEVTCTMTSINDRDNTKPTVPNSEWVYVYKPTLEFKDSEQKYNAALDPNDGFLGSHFVGATWSHPNQNGTIEGTAPTFTFVFNHAAGAFDDGIMNSVRDVPVNVTVTINGTGTAITNNQGVTFTHSTCNHAGCAFNPATEEFIVHVINAITQLTISKSGWNSNDPNQTFLFRVTGKDGDGNNIDLIVTVHEGGSVTIDGLIIGNEYTITEKTDWSWRYDFDSWTYKIGGTQKDSKATNGAEIILGEEDNVITFFNTRAEKYWLDGDSWCDNRFSKTSG